MAFRDSINDLMFRFYERFKQNNNRLPVSVDADINVGDVQIGTVKQGAKDAEAEPWDVNVVNEVQLKGRIVEINNVQFVLDSGNTLIGKSTVRPSASDAASAVFEGVFYHAHDTGEISQATGGTWRHVGVA